jgi:hypothetical protein
MKRAEKYLFLNLDILILKLLNFPAEITFFIDLNLTLFSCDEHFSSVLILT